MTGLAICQGSDPKAGDLLKLAHIDRNKMEES